MPRWFRVIQSPSLRLFAALPGSLWILSQCRRFWGGVRSLFAFREKPFPAVERFAVAFSFSVLIAIGRQFLLNDLCECLDCPASPQPEDESSKNC
ncbi:MAG: hypothetical protein LH660_19025 [Phormidesmis sp. CAN_BIN36]|nr:hypothetical protein [Phormidesmis sp. CAN_BIN36]